MELRHLRYFLAVAQEGTVTGAAARLFVAQPAISRQLRDLERRVGAALFVRGSRGVDLTDAGARLLPLAEQAVAAFDRVLAATADPGAPDRPRSVFTVGLHLGRHAVLDLHDPILLAFRRHHPDLLVRTVDLDLATAHSALRAGTVDAALVRGPVDDDIRLHPLFDEEQGVALAAADPLTDAGVLHADDLSDRPLLGPGAVPARWWRQVTVGSWDPASARIEDRTVLDGRDAVRAAQDGLAFLTPLSTQWMYPQGDLRVVPVVGAPVLTASVAHRHDNPSPYVEAFSRIATGVADRLVGHLPGLHRVPAVRPVT